VRPGSVCSLWRLGLDARSAVLRQATLCAGAELNGSGAGPHESRHGGEAARANLGFVLEPGTSESIVHGRLDYAVLRHDDDWFFREESSRRQPWLLAASVPGRTIERLQNMGTFAEYQLSRRFGCGLLDSGRISKRRKYRPAGSGGGR